MKKGYSTITLLVALAAVLPGCWAADHAATLSRANRLLQTTTTNTTINVTIVKDPAVKQYCDDAGIPESDISITNDQRKEKHSKMSGRFGDILKKVDEAMSKGGGSSNDVVSSAFGTGLGFGIVCGSLAFLSLVFLFFWSVSECCCKKTCCADTQKKEEGRGWFRWCCYISAAVLGLTTIGLTIAYAVYLGRLAKRAPELKCAISIMKSDIVNGYKIDNSSAFVGTTQATKLLGYYVEMLDSITSIKGNAQNVKNKGMTTKADNLVSQENTYRGSFSAATYKHKGVRDNSKDVTVGFALLLGSTLTSEALKKEAATIASTAKEIDSAVTSVANYDSASASNAAGSLRSAQNTMKVQLEDRINSLFNDFVTSSSAPDDQIKKASQGFMAASIIIMIFFTILFLVILGFNIKDRWHPMKCVSKIIMLLELLLAVLILFAGALFAALAIIITYACVAIDGAITTENYLSTNFQGLKTTNEMIKLVNGCLYEKGDGDLFKALGVDLSNINSINSISSGLQSYTAFKANLTAQSAPFVGGDISAKIAQGKNNELELEGSPKEEDTVTGMADFNNYKCSQDIVVLKTAPTGYTASAGGHTDATSKGTQYAIRRTQNDYPASKYATRYSGADCTSVATFGITTATANARLVNLLTAQDALFTVYPALETNYNTNFYTAESGLFTDMKTSVPDLDAIYSKINSAIDYLNTANAQLPKLLDCRIILREVTIFSNILCYRVGEDIYQISGIGLALGFIIFVYAWVMCCAIRLANPKDEKDGQAYQDGQTPYQQPGYYQDGQNKEEYNGYQ